MRLLSAWRPFALLVLALTSPATARTQIDPYIEVQQVLNADLNNGGDVLTYTALAAGVDAQATGKRIEGQVSYRYEYRISESNRLGDQQIHNGIARANVQIVPDILSLEMGGIATRARSDIRGAAPVFLTGDPANIEKVYGGYVGPALKTHAGALNVSASYQLGYVAVDSHDDGVTLPGGQPAIGISDHATTQVATASIGMAPGELPFGWTVTAAYIREDDGQLDQRYQDKTIRGDLIKPISPNVALTAGIGYEKIDASERGILRDANGLPIVDARGRYVIDPSSPRLLAYRFDGLYYDAGVIWKPNRRTTLQVRAGRRYDSFSATGSLDWQIGPKTGLRIGVYDTVDSFGRSLTRTLAALPTSFSINRNPLTGVIDGCVFGTKAGTGGCLNDSFQSLNSALYRSRGIDALFSTKRGVWSLGIGATYANHKYIAPDLPNQFTLNGLSDQSAAIEITAARELTRSSGITASAFFNWYDSGVPGAPAVEAEGLTGAYYHSFGNRLTGQIAAGIFSYDRQALDRQINAQLLLGLRYQF